MNRRHTSLVTVMAGMHIKNPHLMRKVRDIIHTSHKYTFISEYIDSLSTAKSNLLVFPKSARCAWFFPICSFGFRICTLSSRNLWFRFLRLMRSMGAKIEYYRREAVGKWWHCFVSQRRGSFLRRCTQVLRRKKTDDDAGWRKKVSFSTVSRHKRTTHSL